MCAASVPSLSSSSLMVMKQSDEDCMMSESEVFVSGTFSTDSFHSSQRVDDTLEEPLPHLPLKSDLNKSGGMKINFQENGDLIETLPSDDLYRNGLPTYSIMLYKLGSNPSMDNSSADINPLIITTNGGGAPCLAKIFSNLSQPTGLPPTDSDQISSRLNQSRFSSVPNAKTLDPAWLQVLSNILSAPSDVKRVSGSLSENSVKSGSQSLMVSPVSKSGSALSSESTGSQGSSRLNREIPAKIPLLDITNKLTRKQNLGELLLMSPEATILDGQPKASNIAAHATAQSHYLPAFIHKTNLQLHSGSSQHMDLTSSGEDSQMASPFKTDHTRDPSLNHARDTIRMSKLNLPSLSKCPASSHKRCGGLMRESHNMKERRRRARIKNACNLMRQLVPGMSHKTDKATVFEFSARYIHFLKSFVGSSSDKDFLLKYNPY